MPKAKTTNGKPNGSALGFEAQLRVAADKMRGYMDAAANVFWLPPEARWHTINAKAKSPEIVKIIDDAMGAIERENPTLKGVLSRDYARPSLDTATRDSANRNCASRWRDFCAAKDHVRLGGLVDIISNIGFNESAAKSKDDSFRKDDDVRWQFGVPHRTKLFVICDDESCEISSQEIEYLIRKLS